MAVTTFRVRVGDRWYTVEVGDLTRSPVKVIVEGESFFVDLENLPLPPQPPPRPRRGRTRSPAVAPPLASATDAAPHQPPSDNVLRSPMPGRVMSITVRPGQRVSAGEEVCVVEAMKMEQSIRAPRAGVIKAIHVQPLDVVSADDPLIELE